MSYSPLTWYLVLSKSTECQVWFHGASLLVNGYIPAPYGNSGISRISHKYTPNLWSDNYIPYPRQIYWILSMISWSYHTRKWLHPNNVRYSLESPGSVLYTHQILNQTTHYQMLHNAFRCIIFVRLEWVLIQPNCLSTLGALEAVKMTALCITGDDLAVIQQQSLTVTSNGSWRQGIKGEMTCTVYVALVWNITCWIMMMMMMMMMMI